MTMVLDATNKSLVVTLGEAKVSVDCDLTVWYADVTYKTYTDGSSNGTTNGTTQATWVAAPAANTRRRIKQLTLYNNDTSFHSVTVQYNDNGTLRTVWKGTIQAGQLLIYSGGVWNGGLIGTPGPGGANGANGATGTASADLWSRATMTQPPSAASGGWTTVYETSSNPTPHLEDFSVGSFNGVRLRVLTTASGVKLYGVVQSRPGSAYDLIARFRSQSPIFPFETNGYMYWGLLLRESSTGKLATWGPGGVGAQTGFMWASFSTTHTLTNSGGADGAANSQNSQPNDLWLKIHDDHSSTITYYVSLDGNYWVTFGSKAYTATDVDFTTAPNQVGFFLNAGDINTNTERCIDVGSFFAG